MKYTLNDVISILDSYNLKLVDSKEKTISGNTKLLCLDNDGYYVYVKLYSLITKGTIGEKIHPSNNYSIMNINHFLEIHNCNFTCISEKYVNRTSNLEFICLKCSEHVITTWHRIGKTDNPSRQHIICPKCGGRLESLHALVLKQMFMHYYPDSSLEDRSCINPMTNKVMPTDIVNHRLKIAIEIQSQWHDNDYSRIKDSIKKDYWLNQNYNFYALDIREYSVLDMCKIFFDVTELPDFITYEYSNKINVKEIQSLLDEGYSILDISDKLNLNSHRLYDAIQHKKIFYPSSYISSDKSPVVQYDMNGKYLNEYSSISEAAKLNNIKSTNIQTALNNNRHYSSGYLWYYKKECGDAKIVSVNSRFAKYYIPVDKYDLSGNFIQSYNTIIEAAKDNNTLNSTIYHIVNNHKNYKSVNGFTFKNHQ